MQWHGDQNNYSDYNYFDGLMIWSFKFIFDSTIKKRQFVPLNEKFNCNQGHKKLLCTAVIELRSKLTSCMHSPSLQTQYPLGELKIIYCLHSYSKPVQAFPAYHKIPLCGPSLWHVENTSSSFSKLYSEIHLGTRTLFLHVPCTLLILKQINAQIFLSFG